MKTTTSYTSRGILERMYDLTIIGCGPAGAAAAVYAARKQMKTVLLTDVFGGQSVESPDIQNWIGTPHISGVELAKALEKHVREYAGTFVEIRTGVRVNAIAKIESGFSVSVGTDTVEAKTVLVASGGTRRRLDIPGAREFESKGVVYCASCDGPLFSGMDVAVVGGGNAGLETAAQLLAYCKSVTIIHRGDALKGDPVTAQKVLSHPSVRTLLNTTPTAIRGSAFVETLTVQHTKTGETQDIPVSGVFVEIGMVPSTDFVAGLVEVDEYKRIKTNPKNQRTSMEGIWAAGDCTDELYHQNNIAAGDAVKALEDIYQYLRRS